MVRGLSSVSAVLLAGAPGTLPSVKLRPDCFGAGDGAAAGRRGRLGGRLQLGQQQHQHHRMSTSQQYQSWNGITGWHNPGASQGAALCECRRRAKICGSSRNISGRAECSISVAAAASRSCNWHRRRRRAGSNRPNASGGGANWRNLAGSGAGTRPSTGILNPGGRPGGAG